MISISFWVTVAVFFLFAPLITLHIRKSITSKMIEKGKRWATRCTIITVGVVFSTTAIAANLAYYIQQLSNI